MSAQVTAQEAELLRLARAVVGLSSYSEVERLLSTQRPSPAKLGPTAMGLLQRTLSGGVVRAVMRGGGWRKEGGQRLWERQALPRLEFHPPTVELLQWMLRAPLAEVSPPALPDSPADAWADELLLALALALVAGTSCERGLAAQPRVHASAMCWVTQPASIARALAARGQPPAAVPALDLAPQAPLTFLLEAWQPTLASSWARLEASKGELREPAELVALGRTQAVVLDALLAAADRAGRRELLGFLLEAAAQALSGGKVAGDWVKSLSPTAPLRARAEAQREAGALLRALGQLRAWDQEHRTVRFFEDGYEKAQRMVKAWEGLGEDGFLHAQRVLAELEHPV